MTTSKNDITGDEIKTTTASDSYRSGWDRIFGKTAQKNVETLGDYISRVEKEELQKDSDSK
jgi:hypothetical protein